MNERRIVANRRNAKMSTGPASRRGKQRSARNAVKHGLSIAADPAGDNVRALASLLAPTPCSEHLAALAVEAALRIIDHNRVRDAHRALYQSIHERCSDALALIQPQQQPTELGRAAAISASSVKEFQRERVPSLLLSDLAKQLDRLARYDRRTLSARERALAELDRAIERS
jgi:hypothetical protein